ncbi:MAG TPA: hypothetical protein VFB00_01755 [Terriglobales bacterium]|nr:hypothetical protein [Terriglobales bacterium]
MSNRLFALFSALIVTLGMSLFSFVYAQTHQMAVHEPHMSAAMGHLEQAKAELEKAAPNKGGHRERAIQLVDQAIQQVQEGEQYFMQHGGK